MTASIPESVILDTAILRYVLHVKLPEDACQVLLNVQQALKPGGTIYIQAEPVDDSHQTPEHNALWGSIFTAIYEHGQIPTVQEYRDLVTKAGFEDYELHADRIITARKPVS